MAMVLQRGKFTRGGFVRHHVWTDEDFRELEATLKAAALSDDLKENLQGIAHEYLSDRAWTVREVEEIKKKLKETIEHEPNAAQRGIEIDTFVDTYYWKVSHLPSASERKQQLKRIIPSIRKLRVALEGLNLEATFSMVTLSPAARKILTRLVKDLPVLEDSLNGISPGKKGERQKSPNDALNASIRKLSNIYFVATSKKAKVSRNPNDRGRPSGRFLNFCHAFFKIIGCERDYHTKSILGEAARRVTR